MRVFAISKFLCVGASCVLVGQLSSCVLVLSQYAYHWPRKIVPTCFEYIFIGSSVGWLISFMYQYVNVCQVRFMRCEDYSGQVCSVGV